MRPVALAVLGALICIAALAGWFFTAPAVGSGWILFVTFICTFAILNSITQADIAAFSSFMVTLAAGVAWYLHRDIPDSGWVLFLCILCAFRTIFTFQRAMVEMRAVATVEDDDE